MHSTHSSRHFVIELLVLCVICICQSHTHDLVLFHWLNGLNLQIDWFYHCFSCKFTFRFDFISSFQFIFQFQTVRPIVIQNAIVCRDYAKWPCFLNIWIIFHVCIHWKKFEFFWWMWQLCLKNVTSSQWQYIATIVHCNG